MSEGAAPAPVTNGATPAPAAEADASEKTPAPVKEGLPASAGSKPNGKAPAAKPPTPGKAPVPGKADAAAAGKDDTFEIVVDGEKLTLTREQAIRRLQKEIAGDQRLRKGGELVKKASSAIAMMKENPREALSQMGVDVRSFAEQVLQEAVEEAELTPEQKQHRADAKELERLRGFEKTQKEAEEKRALETKDKALFERYEKDFIEAAQRGGLEGTPDNLMRMIEAADEAMEAGYQLTPDQAVAEAKEREDSAFGKLEKRVLGGLKGEALAKRLGPKVVEEVLRWSVERLRGGQPAPRAGPSSAPPAKRPYMTDAEFRKKHGV